VIRKSRLVVSAGLIVALGATSAALGAGAADTQNAFVDGSFTPKKLDKKKYKPIALFSGVRTEIPGGVNGTQSNPLVEYISYPKNGKFDLNAGSVCTTLPPSGSTPEQAKAACPKDSYIGSGQSAVQGPGGVDINDITVSVFRGPAKNGIQLHTYSPTLLAASPTVQGSIVKSNAGKKFGQALSVPHAPETGSLMITKFNATIFKSSKAVLARCKSKTATFQRRVTYADGSSETAETTQKCKQKKKKKKHKKH
jgi:hypothetical protein